MKNEFLKFSSRRILFSAAMVSALLAGSPQMAFAEANDVQAVMQTSVVKVGFLTLLVNRLLVQVL